MSINKSIPVINSQLLDIVCDNSTVNGLRIQAEYNNAKLLTIKAWAYSTKAYYCVAFTVDEIESAANNCIKRVKQEIESRGL